MYVSILQYLEEIAKRHPQKPAFSDLKESFSFSELVYSAKKIGTYISQTISPNNPIVVYMDKRAYNIPSFFGAVYAGCFYVPVDSQMPTERINLILDTLQPSLILYDDVTARNLDNLNSQVEKVHFLTALDTAANDTALNKIRIKAKNTDLLYVLFTSGSTGVPKGVTISHAAVIDFMEWICDTYHLDSSATICNQAPFYFDASVPDLYIPLKTGASVYIPPKGYYTFPKKVLQFICDKQINTLIWVPSALCNVVNCRAFEVCIPDTIRLVIFCGEVMPCKHLNVWKKYIPDALYVNMYGPTEATYACMYYNIEQDFSDEDALPLGKACENSSILLLDENDQPAVDGAVGEICILGQCLSQGYYNAPKKTAASFVQNPLNTKWIELMYRTGDLAYFNDDQEIVFAGRKDFQIKRRGHRIELGEIENAILSLEGIESACCLFKQSSSEIIAVYTGILTSESLQQHLKDKLSSYMLPNSFIMLDAMPMNLNGKIDRPLLKSKFAMED